MEYADWRVACLWRHVMMRAQALDAAGGYREDLIAGEEPELGVRLRSLGYSIQRLDFDMTLHDAAMTRFGQWWRRAVRSGYAFAQGAHLHGRPPERHWVWESRRALIWGLWLPIFCLLLASIFRPWGLLAFLVYPLQLLRRFRHVSGPIQWRMKFVYFDLLARFPEAIGQLKFARDRLFRRPGSLIEYK